LEAKTNRKVEIREFFPNTIAFRAPNGVSVKPTAGTELKYGDYLSEFERYTQKLIRVSGTKRIPEVFDTFSENNTQYVVLSFTESISLREYVEQHGVMSWADCERYFFPVIHALGTIHGQNVEHLGISPDTLRITMDDKMILTDFEMQSVRRAGTDLIEDIYPGCWAIEQYSKTKICDEVTDVYGLCASLLFALSGTVPMEAPKRKQDPRLMISKSILKQLPEHVIPAIANGLQVDADRRTSSFSRFSAELSAEPTVMAKIVETETVRSLPTNTKRSPRSHNLPPFLWLIISFLFSLVVILAIASVWFKDSAFSIQSIMKAFQEPASVDTVQTLKLPDLVGKDYDEVEALTQSDKNYSFTLKIYQESFSDTVPEGQITGQLPFAGETIQAGDTVKVAVSRGAAMRELPDISGMTGEQAMEKLREAGFAPVQVDQVNSEVALGDVIGYESGMAGDIMAYGSVVSVLVSAEESADGGAE
ncbi:MAG: PASTA domain-containing protein, partial [Hominenteromicrobium sp.]